MDVISLFSGCGGLDLGFKNAGYNLLWANDKLGDACSSYSANLGNHVIHEDIMKIDLETIPRTDLIIGGPPCQGFSGIGKRDPDDKRSEMVWRYLEIVDIVRPKIFLFENVTGLKSAKTINGKRVIDGLIKAFGEVGEGYLIRTYTLNAADYGVPQMRKRVFIIGNRIGVDIPPPPVTHSMDGNGLPRWVSSFEALSDLPDPICDGHVSYTKEPDNWFMELMRRGSTETTLHITPYASKKDLEIIKHVRQGGNYKDVPDDVATKRILYFKKTGGRTTTYGRLDPCKPGYTLNTYFDRPNIGCNIHYAKDRIITIREGMRLQSFPDNFTLVSSSKRNYYVQVGNAVPPLFGLAFAKHLKGYIR